MKLKKWLSRGLVLAMVLALMVPVPVAAKSNGGGKLVKSVTYYDVDDSGAWALRDPEDGSAKVTFKYGKKNTPSAVTYTWYNTFLGVPVSGGSSTYEIKYKGNKATEYDTAGFVSSKSTFKNGNLTSWSSDSKESWKTKEGKDYARFSAEVGHASYFKNGLMKAEDYTSSSMNSDNVSTVSTSNAVYAWTQKKGVPSMMYRTSVASYNDNEAETSYAVFNSKGLVIEEGSVVDGKNVPDYAYVYTMKKGKVKEAVVYSIDEKGTPTPLTMMKFAYTNKSISKTTNLKMINDLVGCAGFRWF